MMSFIQKHPLGIVLKILVQPRSSKNEIAGIYGDAIKVRLTAPPVGGEANKMCIQYLSKCLKTPKSSLQILSGQTSRKKQVLWRRQGCKSSDAAESRLKDLIESLTATASKKIP